MLRAIVTLQSGKQVVHLDFSTMHDAVSVTVQAFNDKADTCYLVPGIRLAQVVLACLGRGNHIDALPEYCQCKDCVQGRVDKIAESIVNLRKIGRPAKENA